MNGQAGAVALLAAGALCAFGCSDGDGAGGFRKDYNRIVRQYSTLPVEIGAAIHGASGLSDRELQTQFGGLADRLGQETDKLRKLAPPAAAKDEFEGFLHGLEEVRDDLRAISAAGKAHSSRRATTAARALLRDARAVSTEESALRKAVG
jgi:hypothetical protein